MSTLLLPVFLASLLGSVHCAAMCGGLVAVVGAERKGRVGLGHVAYQAGRLGIYAVLGGLAGALGATLDLGGRWAGLAHAASLGAGVLMLALGLAAFVPEVSAWRARRALTKPRGRALEAWFTRALRAVADGSPVVRGLVLGLASGLLPCGFLHVFLLAATATGSVAHGVLTMVAFWLGTVPMLLGVHTLAWRVSSLLGRRTPALGAVLLVALGLVTLALRSGVGVVPDEAPSCPLHARVDG